MLLVEHDLDFVSGRCDIVTVLHNGRGEDVKRSTPEQMMRLGIGYVAKEGNIFAGLSVADNLRIDGMVAGAKGVEVERVLDLFRRCESTCDRTQPATAAERKMLAIARALLRCPDVLLLDELTEGVWPAVVERIGEALTELGRTRAVLLVEQHVSLALAIATHAHVLDQGRNVIGGRATDLAHDVVSFPRALRCKRLDVNGR